MWSCKYGVSFSLSGRPICCIVLLWAHFMLKWVCWHLFAVLCSEAVWQQFHFAQTLVSSVLADEGLNSWPAYFKLCASPEEICQLSLDGNVQKLHFVIVKALQHWSSQRKVNCTHTLLIRMVIFSVSFFFFASPSHRSSVFIYVDNRSFVNGSSLLGFAALIWCNTSDFIFIFKSFVTCWLNKRNHSKMSSRAFLSFLYGLQNNQLISSSIGSPKNEH